MRHHLYQATFLCCMLAFTACGSVSSSPTDAQIASDAPLSPVDAPADSPADALAPTSDASLARCDPSKPFDAPALVANVNSSFNELSFALTRDERTAFLTRETELPPTSVMIATRSVETEPFGTPAIGATLAALNEESGTEYDPSPSGDGLLLYFHRQTPDLIGVFVATRPDPQAAFNAGSMVTVGGTGLSNALTARISADGQTLYWLDFQEFKLHAATRSGTPAIFGEATAASTISVFHPVLSSDELTLYYSDGFETDILVSTRTSKDTPFGTGVPAANINSPDKDAPLFLTADGCVLYLLSTRPGGQGGMDVWEARRPL